MASQHKPDWTLVSYAEADHEIWQNRYGQLATKTKSGTWKPVTLGCACDEIMLGARITTAIMLLGLTMREAANKVGCTQPQLAVWCSGQRYPREHNELKLERLLIAPALRLELGQPTSIMHGLEMMDD